MIQSYMNILEENYRPIFLVTINAKFSIINYKTIPNFIEFIIHHDQMGLHGEDISSHANKYKNIPY